MSGGPGQRTLFQTWGSSAAPKQPPKGNKKAAVRRKVTPNNPPVPARNPLWPEIGQRSCLPTDDGEDEDDDLMVVAVCEAEKDLQNEEIPNPSYPDLPGFDSSAARVWIYPTNYPLREYQLKISEAALFQNTLVCLPTGLGKTFVASVVMYNFYRWYPSGKIVFMAPTKPLVAQQIQACYNVMGIPQEHMAELTGSTVAKQRQELWRSKRVFFLTPQVMINDLSRDTCPAQRVKCLVVDEAHKALGNHAYCQVIRQLASQTQQFRVLALSATPGSDVKAIQSVISNLLISHLELRSEESPDLQAYSHQRSVDKMVVPLGEKLTSYQNLYLQILEKFMSRLVQNRAMAQKDLRNLTKYQLILARDQFRRNPPSNIQGGQQGALEGDFALCISLYHGYELLLQMGLRSLFLYLQGVMDGSREMARARNELQRTPMFLSLFHEMETMFVRPTAGPDEPFIYGHPKLEKLQDVVLNHFRDTQAAAGSSVQVSTRVMIFSSFRDSVQEIAAMLNRHAPLIRVMTFMGQSSAGKGVKGFTQKEQLEVVQRFRLGDFNTLVSTCVGEEGLDIGEVDLIICFDAQRSPIRLVQRMGRTGRQRQGRIVVILAEGREERTYNTSQSNRRSVFKSIGGNQSGLHMYPSSPRMLPEDLHPTLHKMHITSGQFNQRGSSDTRRSSRGRRSRSGGQSSLIHPQNFAEMETQPSVSDGFLSSSEYSIFTSTMELGEQEAHPTLATSHFLSLPEEPVNLVSCSRPSRVLSLWEWRHWQCKQLPTHQVDHSLRCQNFVQLMALMDTMKDESEGECLYEQQLVSHNPVLKTRPDQHVTRKRPKTKTKQNTLAPTFKLTSVNQEVQETRTFLTNSPTQVQIGTSVPDVSGPPDFEEEVQEVRPSGDAPEQDDQELQAQFYLPSWDPDPPKGVFGDNETHKLILANVTELLSRSPPPLLPVVDDFLEIPEPEEPQPFMVSFTLDVDDDDDDDGEEVMDEELQGLPDLQPAMVRDEVNSPTWDDLFDNDDEDEDDGGSSGLQEPDQEVLVDQREATDAGRKDMKGPDRSEDQLDFAVDQSIDLFADEDFLQMTIPDVPTPEDTEHTENPNASTSLTTEAQVHSDNRTPGDSRSTDRSSHDHFSVNFDLGYSLDSEEEEGPLIHSPDSAKPPESSKPAAIHCSTPQNLLHTRSRQVPFLTPPSVQRPAAAKTSPLAQSARVTCRPEQTSRPTPAKGPEVNFVSDFSLQPDDSDSEEEEVVTKRRRQHKLVFSPDSTNASVAESPLLVGRRRAKLLDTSEQVDDDDGDDFQRPTAFRLPACESNRLRPPKARTKPRARNPARHFLDEEAELSDDEQVSSDEEDGDDQNHSLDGFVVNNTHLSQGLNDSEMQGVYLKSVKSPAPGGRFKMSYRNLGNMDVFSQVPEQDETYAEDSFVVGSEEEEEEEQIDDAQEEVVDLMPENSYVDGRRQYATRRRVLQHRVRAGKQDLPKPTGGTKKTRLIRVVDSSEEEVEGGGVREEEPPPVKPSSSSSQGRDPPVIDSRCRKSVELQHQLSDQLDFTEVENHQAPAGQKPASESASRTSLVRILVDGRCIGSSAELIARLRHHHGATVHVCSLDGSYFIVSNRTAVERHLQSNLAAMQNRKRLTERVTSLLSRFERVCLIVEKDRTKPGETPRPFQRTRYYDSTVAALVSSGVRLLWSDSTEESTNLLAELGRLELRKGHGIDVNPEVKVQRQRALQFCQNLPSVNRVQALYMTQNFPSMVALARSSVESLQKGARLSRHRAEELFRFLRYSCDSFVLSSLKSGKGS